MKKWKVKRKGTSYAGKTWGVWDGSKWLRTRPTTESGGCCYAYFYDSCVKSEAEAMAKAANELDI